MTSHPGYDAGENPLVGVAFQQPGVPEGHYFAVENDNGHAEAAVGAGEKNELGSGLGR